MHAENDCPGRRSGTVTVSAGFVAGMGGVTAGSCTRFGFVLVSEPAVFETVRLTVKDPGRVYSWMGFCWDEDPPSPKSQRQVVGLFVL